jgi:hypothetical protein
MVPDTLVFPHEILPAVIISLSHVVATRPGVIVPLRWKVSGPPRAGNGAGHLFNFQEARAAIDAAEKLCTHSLHLVQTCLFASSFTSVGRRCVSLVYLLVCSPSVPAYAFTRLAGVHEVCSCTRMTRQTKAQQDTTGYDTDDF